MEKILLPVKNTDSLYHVNPQKIIAVGLNYKSHIEESVSVNVQGFSTEIPEEPVLFPKLPNCLTENGKPIIIPSSFLSRYAFDNTRTDYEAELAVIIGKRGKNISPADAAHHIFGYTCMNDVSQRNIQTRDKSGWARGKSFDSFGPIGPCVVRQEDMKDAQSLRLVCRKNGRIVQDADTGEMIFPIHELVSFISHNFTLEPGDIIATGTPQGVGPIAAGDTVEVEIERIGTLRNPVIEE